MKVLFERKFLKEISEVTDKRVKQALEEVLVSIEASKSLNEIVNLKKLKSEKNAYRIRIGDYRLGIYIEDKLARFLHRKDIYKYFP